MRLLPMALASAAAVVLAWMAWPSDPELAAPAARVEAFPWGRAASAEASPLARPASILKAQTEEAPSLLLRAQTTLDVCGLGRVALSDGAPADMALGGVDALPAPVGSEPMAQARERMLADLRSSPLPYGRVAAQMMQRPNANDEPAMQAWAQSTLRQALAQPDPVGLAWAEEACSHLPDAAQQGPACRLSLVRARLKVEPDNALHWAALADQDPGAADEAWQGLLRARRWHEAPQALVVATQKALPDDVPGYLRVALGAEVGSRQGALPSPGEGFIQERCRESDLARAADCQALAKMLVEQSDGLQTLALGLKVGQAAGWSAERVKAVEAELAALGSDHVHWQPGSEQPLSCRAVESWQAHLQRVAAAGELTALRQRLAETQARR